MKTRAIGHLTHRARMPGGGEQENFPVALRVLPALTRARLTAAYRYARYVDDLGDSGPVRDRTASLESVGAAVARLYEGSRSGDPVVDGLRELVEHTGLPRSCLNRLIEANLQDQHVGRYQNFEELLAYCRLSATPVGEMVLHIFDAATPDRIELSDRVCIALQLLEHWQDVGEDHDAGRVYLPKEDLRRFGVEEDDLCAETASPALRHLLAFETERALAWLGAGAPIVSTLHGPARLAVSGYVAGGRAAARRLQQCNYDPLGGGRVKPTGRDVAGAWLSSLVRWPG